MITAPPHNRKLVLLGVSMTKAKVNKQTLSAFAAIRMELEPLLESTGYFVGAAFSWVTISVRFGLVNADKPSYQAIDKRYGDLPLAIEVDTNCIVGLSLEELTLVYERAVLKALIHAGKRYERPTELLEKLIQKLQSS